MCLTTAGCIFVDTCHAQVYHLRLRLSTGWADPVSYRFCWQKCSVATIFLLGVRKGADDFVSASQGAEELQTQGGSN